MPVRARCALVWASKVFIMKLGADAPEIVSFCAELGSKSTSGGPRKAPVKATLVPPDIIEKLEALVSSGHSVPIRVFCGVALLCCHGVKRWGDVQHVSSLRLTKDALVAVTWRSKKKKGPLTWAAL